ncbi:polyphosphate polymerase domain-containing protein [Demequina sp. TTPB684]|uniref:polyphosphate polymerase domain-containing protein n=1 Tax=unclassified Demequina TaxID=2620311 RepID=UPI001CF36899|nr:MULTISPECIES: polyphosphate polymerase domain-containing protein [unclassified Demequina]MCB2411936.1 polyphosphate polymerase domain-containing protein [Demequina sp. TTPB684]UPU88059.1 polyphosphate polymerase domain-containing protein [Demequina sp. TMPB413]
MTWRRIVAALPTITLAELDVQASLQTRVDRKYVVDGDTWASVLTDHARELRALEIDGLRVARYRSLYYDTPALDSYHAAAHRRPRRFKVRVREYSDTGAAAVEVKLRSARGHTVKHRMWLDGSATDADVVAFAGTFPLVAPHAAQLTAALETTYARVTLLHAQGRITVDQDVQAADDAGTRLDYGTALIVETKSAGAAGPIDRALWARGIRPARLSKYATSLAALHPELPANRWHRTLRRHLATA